MGSEDEQELPDRWLLGWRGMRVRRVEASERGTVMALGDRSTLDLPLEGVTLRFASRAHDATATDPLLPDLVGDEVVSSVAFKSGALRVVFRSGLRLDVVASEGRGAWRATGESGRQWGSGVGGLSTSGDAR